MSRMDARLRGEIGYRELLAALIAKPAHNEPEPGRNFRRAIDHAPGVCDQLEREALDRQSRRRVVGLKLPE